jgi:hypothetical protein
MYVCMYACKYACMALSLACLRHHYGVLPPRENAGEPTPCHIFGISSASSIYLFIYLSIFPSIYLSLVHLSFCLSVVCSSTTRATIFAATHEEHPTSHATLLNTPLFAAHPSVSLLSLHGSCNGRVECLQPELVVQVFQRIAQHLHADTKRVTVAYECV